MINYKEALKSRFDSDETYRELLFRRGYLFTDQKLPNLSAYPFYNLWSESRIGRYYLYVQREQTKYIVTKNNASVALIGHAVNPFDETYEEPKLLSDLLAAYEKSPADYFDKLSEFSGLHVIILVDGDKVIGCQDACAFTSLYFGKANGRFFMTEHTQLVADLFDLPYDETVEKLVTSKCYNIGNRHLPGNVTPYTGFKRNGANTYVLYDGEKAQIVRFYPTRPHPECKSREEEEACVQRIAQLLHACVGCCANKWKRCAISLTGGTDSKTTLACANGYYDRFDYFSFVSKPTEQIDADGAASICNQLGLHHTRYDIPEENSQIKDFALMQMILLHNSAYFHPLADNEIRKFVFLHDLDAYDIELKSWASEVPRVFMERKYQIKMPEVLNERHHSIFQTRYFGHPRLLHWSDQKYYEFLREIKLEKPLFNFEHTDLFYWEVRMSAWGASTISSQQMYHRMTIPMNNRKLLDLFLSLPRDFRKDDSAHRAVMNAMNPEVLQANVEIRNLYFKSYRIWLEKIYYYYRTAFYRPKK